MAERKAVIKNADMSEDMQQDAVDCASQALEKYNIEKVSRDGDNIQSNDDSCSNLFNCCTGHCCLHQERIR